MRDDIPEAIRRSANEPAKSSLPIPAIAVGGSIAVAIALIAAALVLWPKGEPAPQAKAGVNPPVVAPPSAAPSPAQIAAASPDASPDRMLGHFAYAEAPIDELAPITADGSVKLRQAAAESYRKMEAAAAAEGVRLIPISGFRSVADQNDLFFRVKEQRNQPVSKRAEVSAPPGHSEHHTGYAVDIGDAERSDTNLSQSFESTPAFQWLSANAARFSFEMSFTQGNAQGVSYEPWHWRFVGDRTSLETFYRAQHLKPGNP
ncbi:D-alanyl-D-alanine carboxypeptidase family protein [Altericista sp. CCNU0014]|uniref:M15 family metallopeptidase n=1 Tax=Altericista sp. CCNU0014 TaxID=3082949 RepID=UPI00384CF0CE